jgi:hypothetical protein
VLARLLEILHSSAIHVINVLDSSIGTVQQSAQFLFAIQQPLTAAILAIIHEQIESEKAGKVSVMEEQVIELWPPAFVE